MAPKRSLWCLSKGGLRELRTCFIRCRRSLAHSSFNLSHSLAHPPPHSLTHHSPTHSLTLSPTQSLTFPCKTRVDRLKRAAQNMHAGSQPVGVLSAAATGKCMQVCTETGACVCMAGCIVWVLLCTITPQQVPHLQVYSSICNMHVHIPNQMAHCPMRQHKHKVVEWQPADNRSKCIARSSPTQLGCLFPRLNTE